MFAHFACVFALFLFRLCFSLQFSFSLFFFVFLCFSLFFFVFLCFSLFYSSQKISVFSAHFQAVAVDRPSKKPEEKEISLRPHLDEPRQKLSERCSFSRLRPNDPSSRLTNDTREDPIMESHWPIAKTNSPKIL